MLDQNSSAQHRTYPAIDLFKFICSILVVAIHVPPFGSNENAGITTWLNYGVQQYIARIAVPFFFIASGFFLFRKISFSNFSCSISNKYALRILRLYLTWTLIYAPFIIKKIVGSPKGILYGVIEFGRDFVFRGSISHLWYLSALIVAVLLLSLLIRYKVDIKLILAAGVFLYIIGLFAQSWFGLIEPLRDASPMIWGFLRGVKKIIGTTRNGLFEGFLFVAIGMCFAQCNIQISIKKSVIGFIVSMILLAIEMVVLYRLNAIREHDMYLLLVPAAFFAFSIAKEIRLPESEIYKVLRIMSSLIYYSHILIRKVVEVLLMKIRDDLPDTCLFFLLTLLVTSIMSYTIYYLTKSKRFSVLKYLYV